MPTDFVAGARCPKCDHADVRVNYSPSLQSSVSVDLYKRRGVLVADAEWCETHEHFLRCCERCRFPWIERPPMCAGRAVCGEEGHNAAREGVKVCGQIGQRTKPHQNPKNPHVCTRAVGHKEIAHKCGTCGEEFLACVVCGRVVDEVKLDGRCTACWTDAPNVQIDAAPLVEPTREAVTIPIEGFGCIRVERSNDGRVFLHIEFPWKRGGVAFGLRLGEAAKLSQELYAAMATLRDKGHTE